MGTTNAEAINNCKYVVIQYEPKQDNNPHYVVISNNWLKRIGNRQMFYWPQKDWTFNVAAVKNCIAADPRTWLLAPVKAIASYSNDLYNAVLCAIVFSRFGVNASNMTRSGLSDFFLEIVNCPVCSKQVHKIAKAMTCTCVVDKKNVSQLDSVSSLKSPLDGSNKSDSHEILLSSLQSREKYIPASSSITSTSSIRPSQWASVDHHCTIDRAASSSIDSDESSPSLLKKKKTTPVSPMSPSLLLPRISRKRTEQVKIRLINKFK